MIGAIALHALWNGSAVFGDFFVLYLTLQVPLFVGFILGVIALRREEARLTRTRLGDYAAAGWFTPQEVDMLATGAGRQARRSTWARTLRGDRTALMKRFIARCHGARGGAPARDHRARPERAAKTSTCCSRARPPRARRDCSRRLRLGRAPEARLSARCPRQCLRDNRALSWPDSRRALAGAACQGPGRPLALTRAHRSGWMDS